MPLSLTDKTANQNGGIIFNKKQSTSIIFLLKNKWVNCDNITVINYKQHAVKIENSRYLTKLMISLLNITTWAF